MRSSIGFINPPANLREMLSDLNVLDIYFDLESLDTQMCDLKYDKEKSGCSTSWRYTLNRLDENIALFARHGRELPKWENLKRLLALRTISLAAELKSKNLKAILFPTGVSHHPVNLCAQIACEISRLPQVFFYKTPISNKLLVYIQSNGMETRFPIAFMNKSDSSLNWTVKGIPGDPTVESLQENENPESNFYKSVYKFSFLYLKHSIKHLFQRLFLMQYRKGGKASSSDITLKPHSYIDQLESMLTHKKSLNFLNSLISSDQDTIELLSYGVDKGPIFEIYAHFQPEASTFAEGDGFNSHIDVVISLREAGIQGPILYREHPGTSNFLNFGYYNGVGYYRNVNYYQTLKSLGCIFVPNKQMLKLTREHIAVTITGSIAVERSLRGQITVYLGFPWWKGLPGTYTLEEYKNGPILLSAREIIEGANLFLNSLFSQSGLVNGLIGRSLPTLGEQEQKQLKDEFNELLIALGNRRMFNYNDASDKEY